MKILVTGFEPFGGEDVNPSWEAVQRLQAPEGTELVRLRLPVVFREAGEQLAAALDRERPDLVLCIGQAAGRDAITPERLGVNLMDASIPDNAGFQPQEEPVIPGSPDANQTMVSKIGDGNSLVQVVSWYDNENSYTSQMVRTIKYLAELK